MLVNVCVLTVPRSMSPFLPHFRSKLPSWARAVVPKIFYVTEKAWNYYPYTVTGKCAVQMCCSAVSLKAPLWHSGRYGNRIAPHCSPTQLSKVTSSNSFPFFLATTHFTHHLSLCRDTSLDVSSALEQCEETREGTWSKLLICAAHF